MKLIAFYLPQFHVIPENEKMWGKGFTEWHNMKRAKPLFEGHYQPRIPLGNNYYNLLDDNVKQWQINLAKRSGIYGFCMYHYWFDGKLLLEKPVEQFLNNKELDINFCLSWANEAWTKAWVSKSDEILYEQRYGTEKNWERHFLYLLPFFKDRRYIKEDNKPLFIIYRPELIGCLNEMLDYFSMRSKEEGFNGMVFAYQHNDFYYVSNKDDSRFKYNIEYEPGYSMSKIKQERRLYNSIFRLGKYVDKITLKLFNETISSFYLKRVRKLNYDKIWQKSISLIPDNKKHIAGAFVDWDNTPRRGRKGYATLGVNPEKFEYYFRKKVESVKKNYSTDYIFITAWNEWAEGGYLEPDEKYKMGYLDAVKKVMESK